MINYELKVNLLNKPSSLEYLPNLSKHLGPEIFVKRDDEGGRGGGGNKLRKYERIIGDAFAQNCDTLIIAGHYQSNAARELVGAACQFGVDAVVVCKEMIPSQNQSFNQNGNALLMSLMQGKIVAIDKDDDFEVEMNKIATKLKNEGKKPYIIPFGGSNFLGSLGYVDCAYEILDQFRIHYPNDVPDYVIVPSGSGGTQAGLVAGFQLKNVKTKVIGFSVLHQEEIIKQIVSDLSTEVIDKLNGQSTTTLNVIVNDDFVGSGYGVPTKKGIDALKLTARLEALFLCPVYTSKSMSGLIDYISQGIITKDDKVVFVHTGGMPLVHAYFDKYVSQ